MRRVRLSTVPVVLVVVPRDDQFLIIQELPRFDRSWYLPAGGVEPGESLGEAAIRETREEAGIDIVPQSLLWMEDETRVNHFGEWRGAWRFIIRADAVDPKQVPHGHPDHTSGARWATLDEIRRLPLRAPDVYEICQAVARGAPEVPLKQIYRRYE
jgi:8-oxo-dGTP pyrophosphatase MutT (NUDIX family)